MKTLFFTFALLVLLAPALQAATLTVNTTADEFNTPSGASRSMREAVRDAAASGDTIVFDSALNGSTLTLTMGTEIVLGKSLTIDATSLAAGITVSGGTGSNRIFSVSSGKTVALLGLTLTGGDGAGAASTGDGGAIYNVGTLTLTGCTVSGNACAAGSGGGIFNLKTGMEVSGHGCPAEWLLG
jgi:hypothetical protein